MTGWGGGGGGAVVVVAVAGTVVGIESKLMRCCCCCLGKNEADVVDVVVVVVVLVGCGGDGTCGFVLGGETSMISRMSLFSCNKETTVVVADGRGAGAAGTAVGADCFPSNESSFSC